MKIKPIIDEINIAKFTDNKNSSPTFLKRFQMKILIFGGEFICICDSKYSIKNWRQKNKFPIKFTISITINVFKGMIEMK
jgi:hypothetical protein